MQQFSVSLAQNLARQKGRRLKMLRALSGLSKQALSDVTGISSSTVDTWESGRVELSQKSAERICEAFKKVGVYCSAEWILTGSGSPPRIMSTLERTVNDASDCFGLNSRIYDEGSASSSKVDLDLSSVDAVGSLCSLKNFPSFTDDRVKEELCFFLNLNPGALYHVVDKDLFESRYREGDCLGGIPANAAGLQSKFVIIAPKGGNSTVFGKLLDYDKVRETCCIAVDQNSTQRHIPVDKIAGVVWHRKAASFFD